MRTTVALLGLLILSSCDTDDGTKTETGQVTTDSGDAPIDTGNPNTETDQDGDGFSDDCDDNNPNVFPGATEFCDGLDNDCDNQVDEDAVDADSWYADEDGDGFGDIDTETTVCDPPAGYVANSSDCDDNDARFNPSAIESDCEDPNDYNCDGSVGFADADADGFAACADCDDSDADVNDDAAEVCNEIDTWMETDTAT